jgi:hypothetical protein
MWEYPEIFESWWGDANTRRIQQLHGYMWNWNKKCTLVNVHQMVGYMLETTFCPAFDNN